MKQDNLEKFIIDHKSQFDTLDSPPFLWNKIEENLNSQNAKRISIYKMIGVAASAIVILTAGLLVGIQLGNKAPHTDQLREFAKAENFYANQYNVKWTELQSLDKEEATSVEEDLIQIDAIYNELKSELLSDPSINTDRAVNILIDNYRTKLELLETVLDRTKKQSNKELNFNTNELDEI